MAIGVTRVHGDSQAVVNVGDSITQNANAVIIDTGIASPVSAIKVIAATGNLAAELGNGTRGVLVDAMCPNHTQTDMGGPLAPRTPDEGADTICWVATRTHDADIQTGFLWEDRKIVPW